MVVPASNNNVILVLVRPDQLRRMLAYMLDENEFLSPYGVRAVSRYHRDHPLVLDLDGKSIGWITSRASPRPTSSAVIPIGADPSGCRSTFSSWRR